jgi:membrane-associated HD superfamily phosphohydrolase
MNFILKGISYALHPLIMPLLGVIFYFSKTPRFIPIEIVQAKVFSTVLLTVILPILVFFLLKTMRKVDSISLKSTNERKLPLFINAIIITLIVSRIFTYNEIPELFYFFIGLLASTITCFILLVFNIKASIHMFAASGFFMFAMVVGIHFKININGTIALMAILLGAIATSRLHLRAHTYPELIIGTLIGFIPQLIVLKYWL